MLGYCEWEGDGDGCGCVEMMGGNLVVYGYGEGVVGRLSPRRGLMVSGE